MGGAADGGVQHELMGWRKEGVFGGRVHHRCWTVLHLHLLLYTAALWGNMRLETPKIRRRQRVVLEQEAFLIFSMYYCVTVHVAVASSDTLKM